MLNADKTFKSEEDVRDVFESIGAMEDATGQPVITSCERGITSCMLFMNLERLGNPNVVNYDGSYADWRLKQQN